MIEYKRGDVLWHARKNIAAYDRIVIAHICNDIGLWGAGFTKALDSY
jgi:hypothetical protein